MNTDLLQQQWAPNEYLVSFGTLMRLISRPCDYLEQQPYALIPSIELAVDGPILESVFLLTDDYICEARLAEGSESFDAALLRTVVNYRMEIGTHEVNPPEPPAKTDDPSAAKDKTPSKKITYQTAKLILVHDHALLRNELNYVGNDRETWLRSARKALPVRILTQSRPDRAAHDTFLALPKKV